MFKKIYTIYISIMLIGFVFMMLVFSQVLENYFTSEKEKQMLNQAKKIAEQYSLAYSMGIYDKNQLDYDIRVLKQHLGSAIWYVDTSGKVYIDRRSSNQYRGYEIDYNEIEKMLRGNVIEIRNKYISVLGYPVVSIGYPIMAGGEVIGGLLLHSSIPEIQKTSRHIITITIISIIAMLVVVFIIAYYFSKKITRPLKLMEIQALKYSKGDFSSQIEIDTRDELEDLANSLNKMAYELQEVDQNRKIFLSNISHDIKTPLTNINGFLEAMKDGTIKKENYDKYINIISNETKRLINLTKEIITLNEISIDKSKIKYEVFDINQLIRDTINVFERKINSKNVSVDLVLAEKITNVKADKEKIRRVLYNLIDNAIKFCYENKKIYIETSIISNTVEILIKDEGIGISENNMNDVWNRFYKVDEARSEEKNSFGLGLFIVKQIIEAHEQEIKIESKKDEWTKITFTLEIVAN